MIGESDFAKEGRRKNGAKDAAQSAVAGIAVDSRRDDGVVLVAVVLGAVDGEPTHPPIRRGGQHR